MAFSRGVSPPNIPSATNQYDRRFQDQFNNVLRFFFNSLANAINSPIPHASYYDTTTQTNPVGGAVNLFVYNSVISEFRVRRGSPTSRVYVAEAGIYNFQFSAQLDKTGGGASTVHIWPRINGVNVPDSATKVVIDGPNNEIVPAWNFVLVMNANDYFELAWESPDDRVISPYEAPTSVYPGIPSIILTVTWVSNYEANE